MLYCINKYIVRNGKQYITDTFYGDEETAQNSYEETTMLKDIDFKIEQTLYEIDTKGFGFNDLKEIPFERYTPIASYTSS